MSMRLKRKKKASSTIDKNNKKPSKNEMEYGPIVVKSLEESNSGIKSERLDIEDSMDLEQEYKYKFESNRNYFSICIYALITIALAGLILYSIMNLPGIKAAIKGFLVVIAPFIAAFFIAFIINPLVKIIERKFFLRVCKISNVKIRLSLSILLSYIITIGLIVIGLFYVIPQVITSISDLTLRIPEIYDEIILFLNNIEEYLAPEVIKWIEETLSEITPQLVNIGSNLVKSLFPVIIDVPVFLAKLAINIFLSIAISIYMLYDKRMLSKHAVRIIYAITTPKKADNFIQISKKCSSIFSGFVVGKSIDSLIIGIICFVAMIILKLPYAVLISVIVGVTNMIPYFGPFIGAVPGVLLYLCIDPLKAVIFVIMIFALQQFDGWILGPKILGDSTGLTPLWVIFGITVGGAYGGVIGMFLGVPLVAVFAYLANLYITAKLKKKKLDIL